MEYFALLSVATVIIAVLAAVLYRQRGDAGTLLGIGALYYWSLFGAWYIVIDKTGGFSGKNYQYLEGKLFPIMLDQDYLVTLGLYAGFVILVELTLLLTVAPVSNREPSPLLLRHAPILWIGLCAGLGSLLLVYDKLSAAWALNVSAYVYTRAQTDEWFTLHQVLNRVALLPPAIGLAVLAAGKRPRVLVSVGRRYTLPSYVLLLGAMGIFTFVLGNKNEILAALVAGVLAYIGTARRPKWIRVGLVLVAGFWFLYAIDLFRAVPLADLREEVGGRAEEATGVARFLTSSNEAYGAHFSMYGVLSGGVEPHFGYSLYSLASSVIPRVLWPDRPRDIYTVLQRKRGSDPEPGLFAASCHGLVSEFRIPGRSAGGHRHGTGVGVLFERAPPDRRRAIISPVRDGGAVVVRGVPGSPDSRRSGRLQGLSDRRRADTGGRAGLFLPEQTRPGQARVASAAWLDLRGRPVTSMVSVVIPCRNEARFIGRCLNAVLASDYPGNLIEVIVADGMSQDGTRQCVAGYMARDSRIRLIDNPAGVTPVALNRAIEAAHGKVILRLDARAEISPEYITRAVASLDSWGADCVGGAMRTLTEDSGKFAASIRIALTHPFGVGNSHFRTGSGSCSDRPRWVDTVYGACWRREIFDRVGWFNERLERSQDIEFSSRLRRAGGRILVSPQMQINYYARGTLGEFWRQNWTNGVWAVLPLACSPGIAVRWRHLAPLGLVTALTVASAAGACSRSGWTAFGWLAAVAGPYVAANVAASLHAAWKERRASLALRMPLIFASLHLAYGAGSLWGCARLACALARQTAIETGPAS